ncbi:photosystem II protein Psb27 [Dactylococcopsis salina PCC 8305]|uniref:Photosystem II lipoprotein Psb27 n=2 Tax=Dactylococcopsis salina TaxID=292566 RepID=K9YX74_DACS8|nr:photosystem II protein Psb27 [Dactylococcopsis salina PCC 8305]
MLKRLLALTLVVVVSTVGLAGCSGDNKGLTGDYRQDTLTVLDTLRTTLELSVDDPQREEVREKARKQLNEYAARYRRDEQVAGLRSFTTMQTALNALANYYTSAYATRPIPDKVKDRVSQEFAQVERALRREET